jgi:hypothetical protein
LTRWINWMSRFRNTFVKVPRQFKYDRRHISSTSADHKTSP